MSCLVRSRLGSTPLRRSLGFALVPLLTACGGGNPNTPAGGPQAVINSPQAGSHTAGTFFFSVQAIDPGQVKSVRFEVGGTSVGTDSTPSDGLRVFVTAADHAAGPLELRAVVSGHDGRTTTLTRTVTNVPQPPSSTTIGPNGAALGTTEADGKLSALLVPPGTANGATITFEAMTEAEVLAETGVDYGSLGITFLGAQSIETTAELDRTLGVSSGGFGPAVQPDQAVVNYLIGPDENGDGVGEVYVVNTASVAPNGDVISDPVPVAQIGTTANVSQAGSSFLAPLATGFDGAPGSVISIPVAGFNPAALYGNVAEFDHADGLVRRFGRIVVDESGAQTFIVQVPPLSRGPAKLTLRNLGSGYASERIDVQITSAAPVSGSPTAVIENTLDLAQEMLEALDTKLAGATETTALSVGMPIVDRVRANLVIMNNGGRPADQAMIEGLAARIIASGVDDVLREVHQELAASSAYFAAQQPGCNDILDRADKGIDMVNTLTDLGDYSPPGTDLPGDMQSYAFDSWWTWVKSTTQVIDEALGGNACRPDKPTSPGPGAKATPSGMGAAVPAGGDMGGSALPPNFRPIPDYSTGLAPMATELARGRFIITVAVGGSSVPFKGTTDAGGYFMVPMIPAGEKFTAVALDTETGENRFVTGTGPEVEDGVFVVFDFTEGESQYVESRWDGGGDGTRWRDALNWEGDVLPQINSNVVIPAGSTVDLDNFSGHSSRVTVNTLAIEAGATLELSRGTLELLAASTIEGQLMLTNGTIHPQASLVMNGDTAWSSGGIAGNGFVNNGTITVNPAPATTPRLHGLLVNQGTLELTGASSTGLIIEEEAHLVNEPVGLFDVQGDVDVGANGNPGQVDNRGIIRKSSGVGESAWGGAEVNHLDGTVEVLAGTLLFSEGSASSGANWEVSAGAVLALGSHTRVNELVGDYSGDGAGVVRLAGGDYFIIGEAGATFDFSGGGIELTRSNLTGPGTLLNAGTFHLVTGTFDPRLTGSIVNQGTLVLRGDPGEQLLNSDGATIVNEVGATIEFHDDQGIDGATDPLHLTNHGTLTKVGGTSTSVLEVCFAGTPHTDANIEIQSATGCQ